MHIRHLRLYQTMQFVLDLLAVTIAWSCTIQMRVLLNPLATQFVSWNSAELWAPSLIMVLLLGLFNSLRDSLLALAGIPFAMGGGVIALFVSGQPLSVSSIVGFISLFGVSVMNGILIITYYNQVKNATGRSGLEAMAHAAEQRMRPLLMTSLAACIGLLPSALSTGIGSQVQRPLASVVVGGMLIGPVLLLLIVPALQMMFLRDDDRARRDAPSP